MKRLLILTLVMIMFGLSASATPFSDVSSGHWAYEALETLAEKGIVTGYPNGTFKGGKIVSRYALALVITKTLSDIEVLIKSGTSSELLSKEDLRSLSKLVEEFADELALVGVKVNALEDDMQMMKDDVAGIKDDVIGIQDFMEKGGMERVKLSGDILIRHSNLTHRSDWATNPLTGAARAGNSNNSYTQNQVRLRFVANIDDNITMIARWGLLRKSADDINGILPARQSAFGRNGIGNGGVTDSVVDYAYLRVKDMFRFGGNFYFGRKAFEAGHNMLVNTWIDAISYEKDFTDVSFALNAFYDRHIGSYKDNAATDMYQVWNMNLGTSYKEHDLYLNFYKQEEPNLANRRFALGLALGTGAGNQSSDSRWDVEFGSKGPLGHNEHWSYDLGFVYTNYQADVSNVAGTNWISPDMDGWMRHVAVNWDSHNAWKSKLSYTCANDEAVGGYAISNDKRYVDAPETPYEDIERGNRYFLNGLYNMSDLKFQVEYKEKKSKHYFRIAGDWLDEVDDTVTNDLTKYQALAGQSTVPVLVVKANTAYDRWNNLGISDPSALVLTFEYRYQLTQNTRVRVGYTYFNFTGDAQKSIGATPAISAGRGFNNDYDYQMFWSEVWSKF